MDSSKHLNLQTLKKNLLNIYKKNKEDIFDIVIFGSFVKGKEDAEDIDIAVIFKKKNNINIIKSIEKITKKIHVDYLLLTELYSQPLWRTLIREGYSVTHNKNLISVFGLESCALVTYNLSSLGKRKSRFSQVLSGYKSESVIKKVEGILLKPGVILVPIKNFEYFRTFLETWNVNYRVKYVYIE